MLAVFVTLALIPIQARVALDPKVIEGCRACHEPNGVSKAQDVPTLAGVSALVRTDALKAYHAKSRPCPKVSYTSDDTQRRGDMCSAVKDLPDPAIAEFANCYASEQQI